MRPWLIMFGGMIVWTVHFFSLYILASLFETTLAARIPVVLITLAAAGADLWLLKIMRRPPSAKAGNRLAGWMQHVGALTALLSLVAVLWQGLPAFLI